MAGFFFIFFCILNSLKLISRKNCLNMCNSYLFGLCLRVEFLFLEQTIKAEMSINAIKPGIAQKTILYGNSTLFIQPSMKMFPELGECLQSFPSIQQDIGAFSLFFFRSSFAVQSPNPEMKFYQS